jgi:hypothetical protein
VTPAEQQAIDRLTADAERDNYDVHLSCAVVNRDDLRIALSLLRPVASVDGVVRELDMVDDTARICSNDESFEGWVNLPGATVGQRVRMPVQAVDGEEK